MRVRVELRRHAGKWIARFRKDEGYTGRLIVTHKTVQDRQIPCLTVHVEPPQGYPHERPPGPELFEFKLTDALEDQLRFSGWELIDGCGHLQQWDCYLLR